MADHIYLKCKGELSGYSPYKVYSEDDWVTVMYSPDGYDKATLHDLNLWWDDLKKTWRWTIYPLHRLGRTFPPTVHDTIMASGECDVMEKHEVDQWLTRNYEEH